MAQFTYTLFTNNVPLIYESAASDAEAARREAVGFLADLLRDAAMGGAPGARLRMEARGSDGGLVCQASAEVGR